MLTESDYRKRLQSLVDRRSVPVWLATDAKHIAKAIGGISPATVVEKLIKDRTDKEFTRYTLGCMEEMPVRSTEISIQEGEKVKNQLTQHLNGQMLYPGFEYQGSVPLNTHIEYASDIDLLVICGDVLTFSTNEPRQPSMVQPPGRFWTQ